MAVKTTPRRTGSIIEELADQNVREQITDILLQGEPIIKKVDDFPDPGPELKVGEVGRVGLEEMDWMERIVPLENNLLPVHFLEEGAVVQRAVCRVNIGNTFGTGFMVSPTIMMTNWHVLRTTLDARRAKIEFNYQLDHNGNPQGVETYTLMPENLFYSNRDLDFAVVKVKPQWRVLPFPGYGAQKFPQKYGFAPQGEEETGIPFAGVGEETEYPYEQMMGGEYPQYGGPGTTRPTPPAITQLRQQPLMSLRRVKMMAGIRWGFIPLPHEVMYAGPADGRHGQHVNIIQHPKARRKEVALQDNTITNIYDKRVRYRTDTEPGSSGSPVFNNAWDLIAIHHAAGDNRDGVWLNNEGMRLDCIVDELRAHFSETLHGQAVLTELGI